MNEEIKEILEQLDIVVNKPLPMLILAPEYTKILLDYITYLQQENSNLKLSNQTLNNQLCLKLYELDHLDENRNELKKDKLEQYVKLQQENERLKEENYKSYDQISAIIYNTRLADKQIRDYKSRCEKAIEYINCNKQKTICAYGDNEDDDFEICLWEEDIDNLLNILQNGSDSQ